MTSGHVTAPRLWPSIGCAAIAAGLHRIYCGFSHWITIGITVSPLTSSESLRSVGKIASYCKTYVFSLRTKGR